MTEALPIEAVQAVTSIKQVAPAQELSRPEAVADPAAVARFQAAMAVDQPQDVSQVASVQSNPPVPFLGTLEDTFRQAEIQNKEITRDLQSLVLASGNGGMSMADMMALQYQVANLSFQQEVVTKVVDRISNAIQTLVKNQ